MSDHFASLRYPDERLLEHHAPLVSLYNEGKTFKEIARELGRTPEGVRNSVRKLRSYGYLPSRRKRQRVEWPIGR